MQCPNCGRNVRSKNQCAYCGHVFNKNEVTEAKHESYDEEVYEEETPRRSSGGFSRVLWGIIKLVLAVAIVFLAFLFGPRLINEVVEYFQPSETAVVQNEPEEEPEQQETPTETTESEESDATQTSEATSETEGSEDATESTSEEGQLAIVNQEVNTDEYPLTNVTLEFDGPLDTVDSETFNFTIETNGETIDLNNNYSLVKDGQNLSINFNDPSIAVLTTEAQEQVLNIASESLGINESITYQVPSTSVDTDQAEFFNTVITDNLSSVGDISAVVYPANSDVPYVYDNQSVDADALISWFILGHTFNSINQGELTLEDAVTVSADLVSENDTGIVASAEEGSQFTVQELMTAVVEANDVSAMNHLIQETGGPNAFNLWLNESNYFSTRVTQLLAQQESGQVVGAVTSAQDIAQLLEKLANDELVTPELDTTYKELLFNSPMTDKYPTEQFEGYVTRYEIASSDTNPSSQNYSGIIELEDTYYIAVIMASNFSSSEEVVPAIATSINEIVTYFETGQTAEEVAAAEAEESSAQAESVVEESTPSQVSVVEESTPSTGTVGEDGRNYSQQFVENIGSYVNLPEETVYDETTGQTRPAEWFYSEEDGRYYYR